MIDGGVLLVVISVALLLIEPAGKLLVHRRETRAEAFSQAVRRAYPLPTPAPTLEDLVVEAETALARTASTTNQH